MTSQFSLRILMLLMFGLPCMFSHPVNPPTLSRSRRSVVLEIDESLDPAEAIEAAELMLEQLRSSLEALSGDSTGEDSDLVIIEAADPVRINLFHSLDTLVQRLASEKQKRYRQKVDRIKELWLESHLALVTLKIANLAITMPARFAKRSQLNRYCVFSFAEDNAGRPKPGQSRFLTCPLTSVQEVTSRLNHSEAYHNKRLRTLENPALYPFIDITFFSSYQPPEEISQSITRNDCMNLHAPEIKLEKACYEEIQVVDPKKDMISTPIDEDPGITAVEWQQEKEESRESTGFILIAFKTMEDMENKGFVQHWKTWTGVRYLCMQMPRCLGLRRISFYSKITKTSAFAYVLVIEISNMLYYTAETLNLLERMKLRLCGYVGAYRQIPYDFDPASDNFFAELRKYPHRRPYVNPLRIPSIVPEINITKYDNDNDYYDMPAPLPPTQPPPPMDPIITSDNYVKIGREAVSNLQLLAAAAPKKDPVPIGRMRRFSMSSELSTAQVSTIQLSSVCADPALAPYVPTINDWEQRRRMNEPATQIQITDNYNYSMNNENSPFIGYDTTKHDQYQTRSNYMVQNLRSNEPVPNIGAASAGILGGTVVGFDHPIRMAEFQVGLANQLPHRYQARQAIDVPNQNGNYYVEQDPNNLTVRAPVASASECDLSERMSNDSSFQNPLFVLNENSYVFHGLEASAHGVASLGGPFMGGYQMQTGPNQENPFLAHQRPVQLNNDTDPTSNWNQGHILKDTKSQATYAENADSEDTVIKETALIDDNRIHPSCDMYQNETLQIGFPSYFPPPTIVAMAPLKMTDTAPKSSARRPSENIDRQFSKLKEKLIKKELENLISPQGSEPNIFLQQRIYQRRNTYYGDMASNPSEDEDILVAEFERAKPRQRHHSSVLERSRPYTSEMLQRKIWQKGDGFGPRPRPRKSSPDAEYGSGRRLPHLPAPIKLESVGELKKSSVVLDSKVKEYISQLERQETVSSADINDSTTSKSDHVYDNISERRSTSPRIVTKIPRASYTPSRRSSRTGSSDCDSDRSRSRDQLLRNVSAYSHPANYSPLPIDYYQNIRRESKIRVGDDERLNRTVVDFSPDTKQHSPKRHSIPVKRKPRVLPKPPV